ncbi:MAG: HNH endonuclease signature motif containing protein [Methanogenium sp.]|jgi:hypothetical protein
MANIPQNTEYQSGSKKSIVSWDIKKLKELRQKALQRYAPEAQSKPTSPLFIPANLMAQMQPVETREPLPNGRIVAPDTSYKSLTVSEYNKDRVGEEGTLGAPLQDYPVEGAIPFTDTTRIANANASPVLEGQWLTDPNNPGALIKNTYVPDEGIKRKLLNGLPSNAYQLDHIVPRWAGGANTAENIEILSLAEHQKKTAIQAVPYTAMYYSYLGTLDDGKMNPQQRQEWNNLSDEQRNYFKDQNTAITPRKALVMAQNWKNYSTAGVPQLQDEDYGKFSADDAIRVMKMWQEVPKTSFKDWLKEIPKAAKQIVSKPFEVAGKALSGIPVLSGLAKGALKGYVSGTTGGYADSMIGGITEDQDAETWKDMSIGGRMLLNQYISQEKKKDPNFNAQGFLSALTPRALDKIEDQASFFGSYRDYGEDVSKTIGNVAGTMVGFGGLYRDFENALFGGGKILGGVRQAVTKPRSFLGEVFNPWAKTASTAKEAVEGVKNTAKIAGEIVEAGKGVGPIAPNAIKTISGMVKDGKIIMDPKSVEPITRGISRMNIAKAMGLQVALGQLVRQDNPDTESRLVRAGTDALFGVALGTQMHNVSGYAKTFMSAFTISLMEGGYQHASGNIEADDILKDAFTNAAIMTGMHATTHAQARPTEKLFDIPKKEKMRIMEERYDKAASDLSEKQLVLYGVLKDPNSKIPNDPRPTREEWMSMDGIEKSRVISEGKKLTIERAHNEIRVNPDGTEMRAIWDDDDLQKALTDIDIFSRQLEKGGMSEEARAKADIADAKTYMERLSTKLDPQGKDTAPAKMVEELIAENPESINTPSIRTPATPEQRQIIGDDAPVDSQFTVTGVSSNTSSKQRENIERVRRAMNPNNTEEKVLDRAYVVVRGEMEPYIRDVESRYNETDVADNVKAYSSNPANYVEMYVPIQNVKTGEVTHIKVGNIATDHRLNKRMMKLPDGGMKDVSFNRAENLSQFGGDYVRIEVDNDQIANWLRRNKLKAGYVKIEKLMFGKSNEPYISAQMSADDAIRSMNDFKDTGLLPTRSRPYADVIQTAHVTNPEEAKIAASEVAKTRDVEPTDELMKIVHEESGADDPMPKKVESVFTNFKTALSREATPETVQKAYSESVANIIEGLPGAENIDIAKIRSMNFLPDEVVLQMLKDPTKVTPTNVFDAILQSKEPIPRLVAEHLKKTYIPEYMSGKGVSAVINQSPVVGSKVVKVDVGEMKRFEPQEGQPSGAKGTEFSPESEARMYDVLGKPEPVKSPKVQETSPEAIVNSPKVQKTSPETTVNSPAEAVKSPVATRQIAEQQTSERLNRQVPQDEIRHVTPKEVTPKNFSDFNEGANVGVTKLLSNEQLNHEVGSPEWRKLESAKSAVSKEKLTEGVQKSVQKFVDANGEPDIQKAYDDFASTFGSWMESQGVKNPFTNRKSDESRAMFHWFQRNAKPIQRKKLMMSSDGKVVTSKLGVDANTEPYSKLDGFVEKFNADNGTDLDLLYLDTGESKQHIKKNTENIALQFDKNGYVVLGSSGNSMDDIFAVKFNKKLVDAFDAQPDRYLNRGESLKTDKEKFVRAFAVDVVGLPKDASRGDLMKRWKELNSHEIVNAHRENGEVPTYTQTVIESPLGPDGKSRFDGTFFIHPKLHSSILEANGMDAKMKWIKPTFVSKIDGKLIAQKGEAVIGSGEHGVLIREMLGRDLRENEILSFNDNVKLGKQAGAWSYEMPATDMRLEFHNKHRQEGGLSFSNLSKYAGNDKSVEPLKANYEKKQKEWEAFNKELLEAKDADALNKVFEKYEEYGIKESSQWEKVRNMMANGAGVDDLRSELASQSRSILTDHVLAGRWIKGDHLRITPSTKSRWKDPMTGKLTEERFLKQDEIAMSTDAWNKAGNPEYVLAYRSPTTRKTSMVKAKVVLVDNANLGDELVMMSHEDVFKRLEGDFDGDSIRFAVIGDENVPMAMADSIQKDREAFGDIELPKLNPYDKEYITPDSLFKGAIEGVRGGDEIGTLASTMRVMNDAVSSGVTFDLSPAKNGYATMTVHAKDGTVLDSMKVKSSLKEGKKRITPSWSVGDDNQKLAALMAQESVDSQKYQNLSNRLSDAERIGLSDTGEILVGKVFDVEDPNIIRGIKTFLSKLQTPYKVEGGKIGSTEEMANEISIYSDLMKKIKQHGGEVGWNGKIIEGLTDATTVNDLGDAIVYKRDKSGASAVKDAANQKKIIGTYKNALATPKLKTFTDLVGQKRLEMAFERWKGSFASQHGKDVETRSGSDIKNDIIATYKSLKANLKPEEDEALRYWLMTDDGANLRNTITNESEKKRLAGMMEDFARSIDAPIDRITGSVDSIDTRGARTKFDKGAVWRLDDIFADTPNEMAKTYYSGKRAFEPEKSVKLGKNLKAEEENTVQKLRVAYQGAKNKKNFPIERIQALTEKLKGGSIEDKNKTLAELRALNKKLGKK